MTTQISFTGEESARFARFAIICLQRMDRVPVRVVGREPLTSRTVRIDGHVTSAMLDGYMRFLVVEELGSTVEYWAAGSNATRSIASTSVVFQLRSDVLEWLRELVVRDGSYVPGLMHEAGDAMADWVRLEECINQRSESSLQELLGLLGATSDEDLAREAALAVRSFAGVATKRRTLQSRTERSLLEQLPTITDVDTRVAIVEDLGYVGSAASLPTLGALLEEEAEADHVRWAAAVALGRLNLRDATPHLVAGTRSTHTWTQAASLLGLARRAEEGDRSELEPVLVEFVRAAPDPILQRYACLALSKFGTLEESTSSALIDLLGDFSVPLGIRGYAALALSAIIGSVAESVRERIEHTLRSVEVDIESEPREPETVWGLEFLAELATLLELHETSFDYYTELGLLFDDWRGPYYEALALYERGEASVDDPAVNEITLFETACRRLDDIVTDDADARQTIEFRREVVRGRLQLQRALEDWQDTYESDQLDELAAHLGDVSRIFARYAGASTSREGVKRLSDREREYLNGTRRLVEVMSTVVRLEAGIRRGTEPAASYRALVGNIADVLQVLSDQFREQLARGPLELAEDAARSVRNTLSVLEDSGSPEAHRERSIRALTVELRTLFRRSTWPMPARACPIGGLGRGTLGALPDDIPGAGTEQEPLRLPASAPPVLNVLAEILEMAPGGATRARVRCDVGGQTVTQPVHAVEGPVRITFLLPDVLSPMATSLCRFSLEFEARDCSQLAATLDLYVRRGAP